MAELVREKNADERKRERNAGNEQARVSEQLKVNREKTVEIGRAAHSVGRGELRADGERRDYSEDKQKQGERQRTARLRFPRVPIGRNTRWILRLRRNPDFNGPLAREIALSHPIDRTLPSCTSRKQQESAEARRCRRQTHTIASLSQ